MSVTRFDQLDEIGNTLVDSHAESCGRAEDHWIATAELVAPWVRLGFQCHFSSRAARHVARGLTGLSDIGPQESLSAFGEYCNLVMGTLGSTFGTATRDALGYDAEIKAMIPSVTIPKIDPSFDLCADKTAAQEQSQDWRIVWLGGEMTCTSTIAIEPEALERTTRVPLTGLLSIVSELDALVVADAVEHDFR